MRDLGLQVIDHVFKIMDIDRESSIREDRGFQWWGKDLAQRVWADPPIKSRGVLVSRLHARADLLDGFTPSKTNLSQLNEVAAQASLSRPIQCADNPSRLQLAASMSVHRQTFEMAKKLFAIAVAIQAAEAQARAQVMATVLGITLAASSHPTAGSRSQDDSTVNVISGMVKPLGEVPSVWSETECEAAFATVRSSRWCLMATAARNGFFAEFPFHRMTSLLKVKTDEVHPDLGRGASLTLTIPARHVEEEALRLALEFNEWELSECSGAHCLGSWHAGPLGLTYVTFLPNLAQWPGLLSVMAMSMVVRAKWVAEKVYADNWNQSVRQASRNH